MSEKGGVHPEITSLIRAKDAVREHMDKGEWLDMLQGMYSICLEVKREDMDPKLKKSIEQELRAQDMFKSPAASARDMNGRSFLYREWFGDLMQLLWSKGYFTNEKYGFHDPAEGRKST